MSMILKKFCAAFMSVIMSANLVMGLPPFDPANQLGSDAMSGFMEKLSPDAQPFSVDSDAQADSGSTSGFMENASKNAHPPRKSTGSPDSSSAPAQNTLRSSP